MDFYMIVYSIGLALLVLGLFAYRLYRAKRQESYVMLNPYDFTVAPTAMKDHELITAFNAQEHDRSVLKKIELLLHQRKLIYKLT